MSDELEVEDTAPNSEDIVVIDDAIVDETSVDTEDETIDSTTKEGGEEIIEPMFEREDWADKVSAFEENYPISRELLAEIGDVILEDTNLWSDEMCLEKALITVLSKKYMPDSERAGDETFLTNYIYNNEAIRTKIVDEYLESLDRDRVPATMNRGGRISLTEPTRPRSISEAGKLAEKMMRR